MIESNLAAETETREIVVSRAFDAPRDLVFDAWSDAVHLAKWFGPDGFSITTSVFELRPGGRWRFVMHGPDGRDYPNLIVYEEIARPERIVYAHHDDMGDGRPQFRTTVTFAAEGERTVVTMRAVFPTAAARAHAVKAYGAIEGAKQTIGRLGEHVAVLKKVPKFGVTRVFDAPRSLVFEAWSKPEHLARWMPPDGFTMPDCNMEFRSGGVFKFVFRGPDGSGAVFDGAFREVIPGERIVFAGQIHEGLDVVTTITFADQGGKTALRVEQAYTAESPATQGAPIGWGQTLDHLEAFVRGARQS